MRFISNGDYIFPFHFPAYWAEHFYTWSYQNGAANPDGIMRLPARLIDILVFGMFGNLGVGYFYVISCILISFFTFYWFSRVFLEVRERGTVILGSLFFALNPIFLGNLSKVGLILAVAMLPLALVALKRGFEAKRFSYFFLCILALNVSLIHPYTFSVNFLVIVVYLLYLGRKHAAWLGDNLHKFGLLIITALLLNAYAILPLTALGTVDKGALSDNVTSTPIDYTSLVDIANTGDIFTALSLSKGVLKDYEFFGPMTWPFYFLGVFVFYALLFGLYARVEKRFRPVDRRRFVLALGLFLLLLVLSTASYLYADSIIKLLIGLPGGWMFRSPLKWQLYMPLLLFICLVVALKYVQGAWARKSLYIAFGFTFVLMNGYLFTQVFDRLLTPRTLTHFSALQKVDLDRKNMLIANDHRCLSIARDNPEVATELNQVLISKAVQTKRIASGDLDTINLSQYDYILGCAGSVNKQLVGQQYHFEPAGTFAQNSYELYRNTKPATYISSTPIAFELNDPQGLGGKHAFVEETLRSPFATVEAGEGPDSTIGLQDVFENLSPNSIQEGVLRSATEPLKPGGQQLYIKNDQPLYYTIKNNRVHLTATQQNDDQNELLPGHQQPLAVRTEQGEGLEFTYENANFSYKNVLVNPSFENGPWQKDVGDCNAYDDQPSIGMAIHKVHKTDGKQALQLQASRHIACTGPEEIPVEPGQHYMLSFDYQSPGNYAGYFVGFNDTNESSTSERLSGEKGEWVSITREIVVPPGATSMRLVVYGYPEVLPGKLGTALYDNFKIIGIPDIKNRFFVVGGNTVAGKAPNVAFKSLNPTKSTVTLSNAREPFYLTTKETYNHLWRLRLDDGSNGPTSLLGSTPSVGEHIRMNGSTNGWFINPADLCASAKAGCTERADGSYDIRLVMEFTPQRWFYIGCLITGITLVGVAIYVIFDIRRAKEHKKGGRL